MKFMTIVRSKETSAEPKLPPPALMEAINRLAEEATKAGVFLGTGGLLPSAINGARVRIDNGKLTVTDGPFTEAKELVGGYAMFQVNSKQDVMTWATRFMELHRKHWPEWEGETEVRQMWEEPPCG
ncbi:MAG TPA: YciI family protein [Caulobacterales bacterium]|nr:YciI family protein [Caulobacterales bacterium]